MSAESSFAFLSRNRVKRVPINLREYDWAPQRSTILGNTAAIPAFRLAGLPHKPKELVNYLKCQGSRAQRRAQPVCRTLIECYKPCGRQAVKISFRVE